MPLWMYTPIPRWCGYQCLGDLRWDPLQQLIGLFYVGRKTANKSGLSWNGLNVRHEIALDRHRLG